MHSLLYKISREKLEPEQFTCAKSLTKSNALDSTGTAVIKQIQQLVTNKDLEFSARLQVLA